MSPSKEKRTDDTLSFGTTLICIFGIPGAGKTSIARKLENHFSASMLVYRFSFDEYTREGQEGTCLRQVNDTVFKLVQEKLCPSKKDDMLLILDDTMHLKSMRRRYWNLCRSYGGAVGFVQLLVETPLSIAIARDRERPASQKVGSSIIHSVQERFEAAMTKYEKFTIKVDGISKELDFDQLTRQIVDFGNQSRSLFKQSSHSHQDHGQMEQPNKYHKIQEHLRQLVHKRIQELPRDQHFHHNREALLLRRREILEKIRDDENLESINIDLSLVTLQISNTKHS